MPTKISLFVFAVILFDCDVAFAYVDPGVGSIIYQILFLIFSSLIVALGIFSKQFKRLFGFIARGIKRIFVKDKSTKPDKE